MAIKFTEEAVDKLMAKAKSLVKNNMGAIEKSWKNSDSNKYSFSVLISMHEGTRNDDQVLILQPTLSYSEKHRESAEVILQHPDQKRLPGT